MKITIVELDLTRREEREFAERMLNVGGLDHGRPEPNYHLKYESPTPPPGPDHVRPEPNNRRYESQTPPPGLQIANSSSDPTGITIHCPEDKLGQAVEAINMEFADETITHEATDTPAPAEAPPKKKRKRRTQAEIAADKAAAAAEAMAGPEVEAETDPVEAIIDEVTFPTEVEKPLVDEPVAEPADTAPPLEPQPPTDSSMAVRKLMLAVAEVPGRTIEDAKAILRKIVGGEITSLRKVDPKFHPAAITALEELIAQGAPTS